MKTNYKSLRGNNVQKTILRSVAVVVSFILISFTVSGQDFWKKLLENSSLNDIAIAMVETSEKNETSNYPTESNNFYLYENAIEPNLEMEDWMLEEYFFGITGLNFAIESEAELKVEEWMLDENLFAIEKNRESKLELEEWMISEEVWKM